MSMERFALIADDHTGAADSGVHFARTGKKTAFLLAADELATASLDKVEVLALSTESRFLQDAEAGAIVRQVIQGCLAQGITRFYKKVDSTMRGNPGSEIEAALEATGARAALICTAMPEAGRTCEEGMILLNGQPLHTTDIGRDPFNPLSTSIIREILAQQSSLPSQHLSLAEIRGEGDGLRKRVATLLEKGCRLIIADGTDADDLQQLARLTLALPDLLPVGAAGLAAALARCQGAGMEQGAEEPVRGRMLAVVGSLAGISREQADAACENGRFALLELDPLAAAADPIGECQRLLALTKELGTHHVLLRTRALTGAVSKSGAEGEEVASALGQVAEAIRLQLACRIVFATGGNTAMAVARAMGIRLVTLEEELVPGVVLGSCTMPGQQHQWFITKAGGFGDRQLLLHLADRFTPNV